MTNDDNERTRRAEQISVELARELERWNGLVADGLVTLCEYHEGVKAARVKAKLATAQLDNEAEPNQPEE